MGARTRGYKRRRTNKSQKYQNRRVRVLRGIGTTQLVASPNAVMPGVSLSPLERLRAEVGEVKQHDLLRGLSVKPTYTNDLIDSETTMIPDIRGAIYNVSKIATGDASNQRNGAVIHPKVLELKGFVQGGTELITFSRGILRTRIIVFQWLPDSSTIAPTVDKLLEPFPSGWTEATQSHCMAALDRGYNKETRTMRKVLWDVTVKTSVYLAQGDDHHGAPFRQYFNKRIPIKIPRIHFSDNNQGTNQVFLMLANDVETDYAGTVNAYPHPALWARLWYRD